MTEHDHPRDGSCLPACPAWAEGALELYALQRRHADMLAACRAAAQVECVIVAAGLPGVELPAFLVEQESLVRLNMVVGRDCRELLLDEWGLRAALTFRGRRHECAIPWAAVVGGVLSAPPRRPRFGVVTGGGAKAGDPAQAGDASGAEVAPVRPRTTLGVIPGGRSGKKD